MGEFLHNIPLYIMGIGVVLLFGLRWFKGRGKS